MKFKDAKVGDKVWHQRFGWGEIIETSFRSSYPIRVSYKSYNGDTYTLEGKAELNDLNPVLFWNEQDLSNDPPPKRKKKVLLRQAVLYNRNTNVYFNTQQFYDSEKAATSSWGSEIKFIKWGGESIEIELDKE